MSTTEADSATNGAPAVERVAPAEETQPTTLAGAGGLVTDDSTKTAVVQEITYHPGRWLVVSCIRHGECVSNTSRGDSNFDSPLTARGREQAAALGRAWRNVRIDHVVSSDLSRAADTARGLADAHATPLAVEIDALLSEHDIGQHARDLLARGRDREYRAAMGGTVDGYANRTHVPPGGESLDSVQARAARFLSKISSRAARLPAPPREFVENVGTDDVAALPEGVPHVVLTSHNIFLVELYEFMRGGFTAEGEHFWTRRVHWSNTDWSRHILWFADGHEDLKATKHVDIRVPLTQSYW